MIWTQWWSLLFSHLISRSKNILMVINVYILCVYSIYQYSCTIWTCADLPFSRPKNQFFFLFLVKILKFRWIEGSNFVRIFLQLQCVKKGPKMLLLWWILSALVPKTCNNRSILENLLEQPNFPLFLCWKLNLLL